MFRSIYELISAFPVGMKVAYTTTGGEDTYAGEIETHTVDGRIVVYDDVDNHVRVYEFDDLVLIKPTPPKINHPCPNKNCFGGVDFSNNICASCQGAGFIVA
jgi:hypothetical protein